MKILMTGGSGLLGQYLIPIIKKQSGDGNMFPIIEVDTPTHEELDITGTIVPQDYDLVIHTAAYTNVTKAEIERQKCFDVNVVGTKNLAEAYKEIPFVYISSE